MNLISVDFRMHHAVGGFSLGYVRRGQQRRTWVESRAHQRRPELGPEAFGVTCLRDGINRLQRRMSTKPLAATDVFARIGQRLGLSSRAVQRTLTQPLRDRRPTFIARHQTIHTLATELGWRPSAAARVVRTGRCDAIALLIPREQPGLYLPGGMLRGLIQGLAAAGISLLVEEVAAHSDEEQRDLRSMRELLVDGFLCLGNAGRQMGDAVIATLAERGQPVIHAGSGSKRDSVAPDERLGADLLCRHLYELGHRRIACTHQSQMSSHERARLEGYRRRMRAWSLPVQQLELDQPSQGRDHMRTVLSGADRPTAIIAQNGWNLSSVVLAAADCGLCLPADLSVATFGNFPDRSLGVTVTTACVDQTEIGRRLAALMLRKLQNPQPSLPIERMAPRLRPGETTGLAPSEIIR